MADIVSFKIEGLDEIQKKLQEELPKDARLAMRIALSAGGGTVKTAMQDEAPVEEDSPDAGFLREHIKTKITVGRDGTTGRAYVGATNEAYPNREGKLGRVSFKTITGKVVNFVSKHAGQVTAAKVARYLEFGTSRMSKHPFMTQAWEKSRQAALDRIIGKLKEKLHL
jgi:HK97 gp10 family phage protein